MEKELETIAAVQKFCDRIRESVVSIHQQFREEGGIKVLNLLFSYLILVSENHFLKLFL